MKGWYGDRQQHSLASKGVRTSVGGLKANGYRDKSMEDYDFKPKSTQDLAKFFEDFFVKDKRNDGNEFWKTKDEAPEELTDLIREAHGDMMPDDHKYQFIWEALSDFSEHEDPDDAIDYIEADVYTGQLTHWLSSNINRVYYLSEAMEEFSPEDGFQALSIAQWKEKNEVYWSVRNSLDKIVEEYE